MQGDQNSKLHDRTDKIHAKPFQRQRQQSLGKRERNHQIGPLRDMPTPIEDKHHAKHRQTRGGDQQHGGMDHRKNRGEIERVEFQFARQHGSNRI